MAGRFPWAELRVKALTDPEAKVQYEAELANLCLPPLCNRPAFHCGGHVGGDVLPEELDQS